MIRLLKRLAILAVLWLTATIGLLTYFNTRSEHQMEADIQRIAGPIDAALASALIGSAEVEPLPADDVMRAETETTVAQVEALYDELIAAHQALHEAHTDEWEKRWAADAVTLAKMDKRRAMDDIARVSGHVDNPPRPQHYDTEAWAVSARLDAARSTAAMYKAHLESELAQTREKLAALTAAPRQ